MLPKRWPPKSPDRSFGRKSWGDEGYAREELVAELASAQQAVDYLHGLQAKPDTQAA